MMRLLKIGGLLWLSASLGWSADQKGGTPKPKAPTPKAVPGPKNGGKMPPVRLQNPGSMAAQLYRMTPEQRERVLEKLPPARQAQLRQHLAEFDSLPPAEQQRLIRGADKLASMPPEREREIRQSWQAFQKLPQERRQAIRQVLNRMQTMPEAQRELIMNSDQFKSRFSPDEQRIIRDMSDIVMPPM
jgi:Protein of unknown function (DUF3106)